ncbi:uncharacterized protein [Miscanthus floridulus]|uniref:uncharacterized protein isoform X2 n=1 Tax=Miscanthus floridulus TaxID=154761 RepID=UPI00345887B1
MGRIGDLRIARLNLLTVSWIRNRVPPGGVRWEEAQQEARCKRPGPPQLLARADGQTRCWPVASCCSLSVGSETACLRGVCGGRRHSKRHAASDLGHRSYWPGLMAKRAVTTEGMTQDADEILYEVE